MNELQQTSSDATGGPARDFKILLFEPLSITALRSLSTPAHASKRNKKVQERLTCLAMSDFEIVEGDIQPPIVGSVNPLHSPWDTCCKVSTIDSERQDRRSGMAASGQQCRSERGKTGENKRGSINGVATNCEKLQNETSKQMRPRPQKNAGRSVSLAENLSIFSILFKASGTQKSWGGPTWAGPNVGATGVKPKCVQTCMYVFIFL